MTQPYFNWPEVVAGYQDDFGPISPDIYQMAGKYWHWAARWAEQELGDANDGHTLLLEAAARVCQSPAYQAGAITSLATYLKITYRHLVSRRKERLLRQQQLIEKQVAAAPDGVSAVIMPPPEPEAWERYEREERLRWIMARLPPDVQRIFQWRMLDYSFEEIGAALAQNPAVVRNKLNRHVKRLADEWQATAL